jgi:uncharacterized protein (DUF2267 family)
MKHQEFIEQVQERPPIETREQAVRATQAVLETLGERLYLHRRERRHLVSQLPQDLKDFLRERKGSSHYSLEEFYNRVGARADVHHSDAVALSRAVIAVLRSVIPPGEWAHLVGEMPHDYDKLLVG